MGSNQRERERVDLPRNIVLLSNSDLAFYKIQVNFFSKFWWFFDFLHRFKKILVINYKKGQCYGIAWLFHFKMSPNTAMWHSGYGDYLLFVPYCRLLSYCSVKLAEMRAEGYIFCNLSPLGLGCYWLLPPHPTSLLCLKCLLRDKTIGRNNMERLSVKMINNLDQYPLPNPPLHIVRLADFVYTSRHPTTQLA